MWGFPGPQMSVSSLCRASSANGECQPESSRVHDSYIKLSSTACEYLGLNWQLCLLGMTCLGCFGAIIYVKLNH